MQALIYICIAAIALFHTVVDAMIDSLSAQSTNCRVQGTHDRLLRLTYKCLRMIFSFWLSLCQPGLTLWLCEQQIIGCL